VYTIAYRVQYTFTRVHARTPNGHPREDPGEEKRAYRSSRRTSRRRLSCVSGSWQAEREVAEDPRAEVGKDVRVGVGVGPMEFKLNCVAVTFGALRRRTSTHLRWMRLRAAPHPV